MRNLGTKLVKLRKERELTQQQLSASINYSDKVISKWERGESEPTLEAIIILARFYEISVDELLKDSEEVIVLNKSNFEEEEEETENSKYTSGIIPYFQINANYLIKAFICFLISAISSIIIFSSLLSPDFFVSVKQPLNYHFPIYWIYVYILLVIGSSLIYLWIIGYFGLKGFFKENKYIYNESLCNINKFIIFFFVFYIFIDLIFLLDCSSEPNLPDVEFLIHPILILITIFILIFDNKKTRKYIKEVEYKS